MAKQVESLWSGLTDNSGQPLAAGRVYTYHAGTTLPAKTYVSGDKELLAPNPIVLDGHGKALVYAEGRYKFVVEDSTGAVIQTNDNLVYGDVDLNTFWGGTATGTANALKVTLPNFPAYVEGMRLSLITGAAQNTGSATLQVDTLPPVRVLSSAGSIELVPGDLDASSVYSFVYSNGVFYLLVDEINVPSGDVSMGGYKHVNVAPATDVDQYATYGQLQSYATYGQLQSVESSIESAFQAGDVALRSEIVAGDAAALKRDGSNAATGNLNLGANRITNLATGAARTDAAQVGQVQDGDFIWLGTTGGTATAQTATAIPAITAYKAGQKFRMLVGSGLGSTGVGATTHTLNVNSIGAKQIVSNDGLNSSPTAGSWVAGAILELVYDGTYFRITNDPSGWLTWTPNLRTSNATVATPAYPLALYRKQGKTVTLLFNFTFGISVAGNTIKCDLPVSSADVGVLWLQSTFGAFSGGVSYIGQAYIDVATELILQQNLLSGTNWAVTTAPNAAVRGTFIYRSV